MSRDTGRTPGSKSRATTSRASRHPTPAAPPAGVAARRLAVEALVRIDTQGAYANLVLPAMLERSDLDTRDRGFVTQLVYGTTRMQRACDWLVDRFVLNELDAPTRALLRIGAYQLAFLETPAHAAVSATVEAAPRKVRGLVNAVLRRVADSARSWPDEATRLSYPDWVIDRLERDLGHDTAIAALESMNLAASATERDDGYIQDRGSQWVAEAVGAQRGDRVLDLCAAPGGKATLLAAAATFVVAADLRPNRARIIDENVKRLGLESTVAVLAADGRHPPLQPGSFDRILLDAPCSGLGSLRRRPDARWRVAETDIENLAVLQRELVDATLSLLAPGGTFVYSVCTLTDAESLAVDEHLAAIRPDLVPVALSGPWQPHGRGARLLPQTEGTDGMYVLRLTDGVGRADAPAPPGDDAPDGGSHA
jgi:16S rRNA (cytosine967-C5)-methyltransferase